MVLSSSDSFSEKVRSKEGDQRSVETFGTVATVSTVPKVTGVSSPLQQQPALD